MNKRTKLWGRLAAAFAICFLTVTNVAEASGGEEYITIKVQASDESEGLKYAIDSKDEAAFSEQNEFTIPAGTSHTIYVKDAAGNITSQVYHPTGNVETGNIETEEDVQDTQQINIDLELGNGKTGDYSNYEYLTDDPVDKGTGTVTSKITTDGSDTDEKVFYTVKSDTGEVFYLVIDQSHSTDNVYLLNPVTLNDLKSLASDDGTSGAKESDEEDNLLDALRENREEKASDNADTGSKQKKNNTFSNNLIFLVIMVIGGGVYYYIKVYKNKKDEMMDTMDAMDMEEFEAEEEEEEVEFDVDDEEKERYIQQLIEEEEMLYDKDPDHYYEEHSKAEKEDMEDPEEEFNFADEEEDEEEDEES